MIVQTSVLKHKNMQPRLTRRLLRAIRRQRMMLAGDCVGVGVSGGADSVALLRLLVEFAAGTGIAPRRSALQSSVARRGV